MPTVAAIGKAVADVEIIDVDAFEDNVARATSTSTKGEVMFEGAGGCDEGPDSKQEWNEKAVVNVLTAMMSQTLPDERAPHRRLTTLHQRRGHLDWTAPGRRDRIILRIVRIQRHSMFTGLRRCWCSRSSIVSGAIRALRRFSWVRHLRCRGILSFRTNTMASHALTTREGMARHSMLGAEILGDSCDATAKRTFEAKDAQNGLGSSVDSLGWSCRRVVSGSDCWVYVRNRDEIVYGIRLQVVNRRMCVGTYRANAAYLHHAAFEAPRDKLWFTNLRIPLH